MSGHRNSFDTLLASLNPQQREAVLYYDTQELIVAGAGSGKTRVLMVKAVYYCTVLNIPPESLLCITFTNKAAQEMRNRLVSYKLSVAVDTFHATCLKILSAHGYHTGIKSPVIVYDEQDQAEVIKDCLEELKIDKKSLSPPAVVEWISRMKDELKEPSDPECLRNRLFSNVYTLYEQKLAQQKALDFGDLIGKTVLLFRQCPDIYRYYQRKYTHVLVDEYQDTNTAQAVFLQLLAGDNKHLCVVGDPDQSIYGWRGANIHNILEFEKCFPDVRIFKLERNYRSTDLILNATNSLIAVNMARPEKTLWTDKTARQKVIYYKVNSDRDEARMIGRLVNEHKMAGIPCSEMAVFYRTHNLSRTIEEAFIEQGISYVVVGGLPFYQRREIKDILCYLRVLVSPDDRVAWKRILNVPARGLGEKSIGKIMDFSSHIAGTFFDAVKLHEQISGLSKKVQESLDHLVNVVETYSARFSQQGSWGVLVDELIDEIGYIAYLREVDVPEKATVRIENLRSLSEAVSEFQETHPGAALDQFLSTIALRSDIDDWDNTRDCVSLMSLHCAKGLEFEIVFLIGMEEGLLPYFREGEIPEEIEEERRLCYVGMTRAKEFLYLFSCNQRFSYNRTVVAPVSRFVQEIPDQFLEVRTVSPEKRKHSYYDYTEAPASDDRYNTFIDEFGPGDLVYHYDLGKGTVLGGSGYGRKKKLIIQFDGDTRPHVVLASYAGLTKLEHCN